MASFSLLFYQYMLLYTANKGDNMVEKVIFDKNIIYKLTKRVDDKLIIQYNLKNKRAFFKTDKMSKRKAICIDRIINI